ncbi:MAG: phasin family protein, partial [Pseudomonadota bacterium]
QMERVAGSMQGMAALGQASMEAMTKAANAIGSEMMAFSRRSVEGSLCAAREIAAARSLSEAVEAQGAFARAQMADGLEQAARVNELALEASREAMAPLSGRATRAEARAED